MTDDQNKSWKWKLGSIEVRVERVPKQIGRRFIEVRYQRVQKQIAKVDKVVVACWPYGDVDIDALVSKESSYYKDWVVPTTIMFFLFFLLNSVPYHYIGTSIALMTEGFAAYFAVRNMAMMRDVTHICMSGNGIRFDWIFIAKLWYTKSILWRELSAVYALKKGKKTFLCFNRKRGRVFKIKAESIRSIKSWNTIRSCIEKWAPHVVVDGNIDESIIRLLEQDTHQASYTDIWLEAFSAPPKRERLLPLEAGTKLDDSKYSIVNQLGVGGQGTAYLATLGAGKMPALPARSQVVLKEYMLPVYVDVRARKQALERFQREAEVLQKLHHDNIVKLIDHFVADHRAYLVLEYINGKSLRELVLTHGPMNEQEVIALALVMCDILQYLHGQTPPIVHRDFTPDNLICDEHAQLKLIDFMVAQQGESTQTHTVVGKHAYLSPEQFRGKATIQSDIYSFGATLSFLLTGEDPEPITQLHPVLINSNISAQMDTIVARATALNTKERYISVQEIKQALLALLKNNDFKCIEIPQSS